MVYYIGRGIASVAEQLKTTKEKAQEIQDKVFKGFPAIPKFEDESKESAKELGFVETLWGRKRRLPKIQLDKYEFDFSNFVVDDFDPLAFENSNILDVREKAENDIIYKYTRQLDKAYGRVAKEQIKAKAREEGIIIKDNGGFIADAERQCVNSRIQGKPNRFNCPYTLNPITQGCVA